MNENIYSHFIGYRIGRLPSRKAHHLFHKLGGEYSSMCGGTNTTKVSELDTLDAGVVESFFKTHVVCERCLIYTTTGYRPGFWAGLTPIQRKEQHKLWSVWRPFFKLKK